MSLRHVASALLVVGVACGAQSDDALSSGSPETIPTTTVPSTVSVRQDPVKSVEGRVDLGGGRYLDPAPGAVPAFSGEEIRQLAPRLNGQATVETIVIGYYHDPANEQPGDEPILVYVVTFAQQECVPTAPAPPSGETAVSVATVRCNPAEIIDATTGSTVISIVGP